MKRSHEQIDANSSDGAPASTTTVAGAGEMNPPKKLHVESQRDAPKDGEEGLADFIGRNQVQGLLRELVNKKHVLAETRKELELMHQKSREMEALVSLIQRAWSQLDIDASLLLDSLGDPEAMISERGSSDMLF
eukprot:gene36542-44330_t